MTMSMTLLSFFVWFTCLMVSNYVVGVMFDLSHLPSWASGMLRCLPGALAASTFLWSIKLPDGRYLFRQWEGEDLQFATPAQKVMLLVALLIVLALPCYWLFWPYISDWLNAR
jgi:hypothetical protein